MRCRACAAVAGLTVLAALPTPTSAPLTIIATSEIERSPMQLPADMMVQPTREAGMLSTSFVEMSSSDAAAAAWEAGGARTAWT